jgi:hypothetical protein
MDTGGESAANMIRFVATGTRIQYRSGAASRLIALALLAALVLGQVWCVASIPAGIAHAAAHADSARGGIPSVAFAAGAAVEDAEPVASGVSDDAGCRLSCTIVLTAANPIVADARARHVWSADDPFERASHLAAPPEHRPRQQPFHDFTAIERARPF